MGKKSLFLRLFIFPIKIVSKLSYNDLLTIFLGALVNMTYLHFVKITCCN